MLQIWLLATGKRWVTRLCVQSKTLMLVGVRKSATFHCKGRGKEVKQPDLDENSPIKFRLFEPPK